MTIRERVRSFVPIETASLPRPLHRFGDPFPTSIAETFTAAYTPERGVVLDPLAYPLSAADAAERSDRRAIASSLSPLGAWARRVVNAAPAVDVTLAALEQLGESALGAEPHAIAMRELYASRCGTCRAPVVVEAFLWERDAPAPTKKAFRCGICAREGRALLIEAVSSEDEERAAAVAPRDLAYWQLVERFGQEGALGESVAALYTPRNLRAVMATLRAIETAAAHGPAQDLLKLAFIEVIVAGSRLNAVAGHGTPLRIERGRARTGHASQSREVNVWLEYERTVRDLVTWIAAERRDRPARSSAAFTDPSAPADLVMFEAPVEDGLGGWMSVAAVLCLGTKALRAQDVGDSRVVPRERLLRVMRQAFTAAHSGSHEDAPAVVYVPRAETATIAAAALAGAGAGYRLRSVLYQRDALPTASSSANGAAAILDFDRDTALLKDQPSADAPTVEEAIRAGVREAIVARGTPVEGDLVAVAALEALASRGLLAPLSLARAGGTSELELFLDHLRSALGDAKRSGIERVAREGTPAYTLAGDPPETAPLDDRVEWGVWGLLAASRDIETRALLRRAYALCRGIETPDRELVERCIAAYGAQNEEGKWRLRDADALARRQTEQTSLIAELVGAGRRLGFKVHIGRDLQRRPMPPALAERGALLCDLLTDAERTAVLSKSVRGPADALAFVDCLWYDRAGMAFIWQVDWTARLHRSVVALGESIPDDDRVFRFVAVPDERRALVGYKLIRSAGLADVVRRRGWRFVKWGPLRAFAADEQATLNSLEPVLGLEPAVEQAGQQLAFRW